MLEHLLHVDPEDFADFTPVEDVSPTAEVDARYATTKLFEELGAPPSAAVKEKAQRASAERAFVALTATTDEDEQKRQLAEMNCPAAVRELVGMLTAYEWAFVEQAKQLRGYAVAKLVEETTHPDARIRLKALELVGKITEVALFTERSEVKHTNVSDSELDEMLKARLAQYASMMKDVPGETFAGESEKIPLPAPE